VIVAMVKSSFLGLGFLLATARTIIGLFGMPKLLICFQGSQTALPNNPFVIMNGNFPPFIGQITGTRTVDRYLSPELAGITPNCKFVRSPSMPRRQAA